MPAMSLHWSSFLETVRDSLVESSTGRLVIVSPYITASALDKLASPFKDQEVTVLTSWKATHLIQNRSYLDVYPICRERGWELRILDSLHAKIYAAPPEEAWVGSANLTGRGMGLVANPNEEVMTRISPSEDDCMAIQGLVDSGIPVDDGIYDYYVEWRDRQPEMAEPDFEPPNPPTNDRGDLSLDQFPLSGSAASLHEVLAGKERFTEEEVRIAERDASLLGTGFVSDRNDFLGSLAPRFFRIPIVEKTLSGVGEDWSNFGKIRRSISDSCGGRDSVERDELNRCTNVLFDWAQDIDETRDSPLYEFGFPRHTRLIRRVSKGLRQKQIKAILLAGFEEGNWYSRSDAIQVVIDSRMLSDPDYTRLDDGERQFKRRTSNSLKVLCDSGDLVDEWVSESRKRYRLAK